MNSICPVITMNVAVTNHENAVITVRKLSTESQGAYVCVSNVHMCMEVLDSAHFRALVNNADLVIPDGKPISWAQQLLGYKDAQQVRGEDIMHALCEKSDKGSFNIGLYGGSSESLLEVVKEKLSITHPNINITFGYSPPFRPLTAQEDEKLIKEINDSNVNVLFVGIGCPKQERWMAAHKEHLNCVMLGVGAAFDFIAGSQKHAPRWIQKIGMEWAFRLSCEPKRLWKRYLKQNPRFMYHFFKQYIRYKLEG